MKRKKSRATKRNPVAKAVRKIRPKVVPDTRRKKIVRAEKRETEQDFD